MCTVVILRRPDHRWPVLIGANRDEMIDRPWKPPGRHWPDRPEVVAGLDILAGGSWLGINDWGVAAAVLNRTCYKSVADLPGAQDRADQRRRDPPGRNAVDQQEAGKQEGSGPGVVRIR